jgi:hypothetical protein
MYPDESPRLRRLTLGALLLGRAARHMCFPALQRQQPRYLQEFISLSYIKCSIDLGLAAVLPISALS